MKRRMFLTGAVAVAVSGAVGCRGRSRRTVVGYPLGRHAGPVFAAALLDDQRAFSADRGDQAKICCWDLAARRAAWAVRMPGPVRHLDVAVWDRSRLVVMGRSAQISCLIVLEAATGRELRRIDLPLRVPFGIGGMTTMPAAHVLIGDYDRGTPCGSRRWSLDSGRAVQRYQYAAEHVTPDRRFAVEGARIWSLDTERVAIEHPSRWPTWAVAVAPDGLRAVSQAGGAAFLWDGSGAIRRFRAQGSLWTGDFTRDGRYLLTGDDSRLVLRDAHSGAALADLHGHRGGIRAVATSPGGRHVLSGDTDGGVIHWLLPGA
jgi:WD40 repeat protein